VNILVTGVSGLLAPYVIKNLPKIKYNLYTCSRTAGTNLIDLTDLNLVKIFLEEIKPSIVIHCAAFTDVDKAEKYPEVAFKNNYIATKNLVENVSQNCHFIYLSTDQVYAKNKGLHKEGTENPINVYGKSKWLGALEVRKHNKHTILHTNMFGPSISKKISFSDEIIRLLENKLKLKLFSDSFFSPLYINDIAFYINLLIIKKIYGTYNLGSRNGISKEGFIKELGNHLEIKTMNAYSVKSSEIDGRVKRTLDLRLDVTKIERALKIEMPNLIENIKKL